MLSNLLRPRRPVVPLVRLAGPIGLSMPGRPGLTFQAVEPALERAFRLRGAVAVALVVNSPGGSPVQSHLIFRRIRELADEKKLPVVAYVEDVAASGGYMLACAADEIVVDPLSIVGSIGVVSAGFGFDRAIERLGIDRRVYTAGAHKATLDPFRPENPDDVEHLKSLQRDIHEAFRALVRERRGDRLAADDNLFSGLFWVGGRGIDLGLADRAGTPHEDLKSKFGDKVELRMVNGEKGLLRKRLLGFTASGNPPSLISVHEAITALELRALYSRYGL